jgi:hypothetical protein
MLRFPIYFISWWKEFLGVALNPTAEQFCIVVFATCTLHENVL